ncbi:hypothetical protein [Actinomadura atramentaria]|uniref:hypothetical protein n=1 Tax=Actinomadura atramentaria TaxID=1990 RepID=UPI0003761571|nr:hypothetical protein [Actinomadura atramentaria]
MGVLRPVVVPAEFAREALETLADALRELGARCGVVVRAEMAVLYVAPVALHGSRHGRWRSQEVTVTADSVAVWFATVEGLRAVGAVTRPARAARTLYDALHEPR